MVDGDSSALTCACNMNSLPWHGAVYFASWAVLVQFMLLYVLAVIIVDLDTGLLPGWHQHLHEDHEHGQVAGGEHG